LCPKGSLYPECASTSEEINFDTWLATAMLEVDASGKRWFAAEASASSSWAIVRG
jgi:hypothetical protein